MPNFNLGVTLKPMPNGSLYVGLCDIVESGRRRIRRHQHGLWWLEADPATAATNQIFGPEKNKAIEVGTKWELFDRHLLVTAALVPDRKEQCARGA